LKELRIEAKEEHMSAIIVRCPACSTKNRIADTKQHQHPRCGKCGEEIAMDHYAVPVVLGDATMNDFLQSEKLPILVDFFSPTCGPCATLAPIIDNLARQFLGKVILAKVDITHNPGCTSHFKVRGVPTLIFLKDGRQVEQIVGLPDRKHLLAKLEYYAG
jgi:thioredoxin 2